MRSPGRIDMPVAGIDSSTRSTKVLERADPARGAGATPGRHGGPSGRLVAGAPGGRPRRFPGRWTTQETPELSAFWRRA
ncbi:hypothetical protein LI90_4440 [Carbonactinospora thermoautotrophica]|uniref:Uncharacterized protein n=1 Tax=Carbonactinospora thermoautotrophica TaxID=1469144 RepID=A0A132MIM0_9ACTN|nr:hypothetical protein LI90_4440 [Carbonactinospora thermoautotrophica]